MLLSSCDGYLLEPIEWPKGSQTSCGILREDSGLLSKALQEKKGPISRRENLVVSFEVQRECGVSHEVRKGALGASHVVPDKSGFPCESRGERVIALESR